MSVVSSSLPALNLFASLPSAPLPNDLSPPSPPPIPIPKYKYPPPIKNSQTTPPPPPPPALKLPHRNTKYYKPVKSGDVLGDSSDRAVLIGQSGVSYLLPGAPFEFQFSYSETPKAKPLAIREPAFLPFAPPSMPRPWTGKASLKKQKEKKKKRKIPLFDSFNPPPAGKNGVKYVEMPRPFPMERFPVEGRTREEVLGPPLKKWEIRELVKPLLSDNRQVNLGRDGLTHNMLDLVHTHWKRQCVCKVRCKGVPTVDMDNVCRVLEEKTGGKIIHRMGGVIYLFRGRNYNYRTRPQYPMMLWKPAAPVYPKLIQEAPEGLTKAEADELREKGKRLLPICKLAKNGVYITLVRNVRSAFEGSPLVKIDCKGMHASDYKKLGAKLMELVPCVLLSFDHEQILMWRGPNWKSRYPQVSRLSLPAEVDTATAFDDSGNSDGACSEPDTEVVRSSPRMMSLWKHAIESSKAILLDKMDLGPDALLQKVEEFESISQATEHSYQALVLSAEDTDLQMTANEDSSSNKDFDDDEEAYSDYEEQDDEDLESDSFEDTDPSVCFGSLPIDQLANKLYQE